MVCSIWNISGKTWSKIKSKSFEKLGSWGFQNCPYFWFLTMFYQRYFRLNTPKVKWKSDLFRMSPFMYKWNLKCMCKVVAKHYWQWQEGLTIIVILKTNILTSFIMQGKLFKTVMFDILYPEIFPHWDTV